MSEAGAEVALTFHCEGETLVGILHRPAADASEKPPAQAARADHAPPADHAARATVGVVVIVGGPQYRAGSHRQFVHLARGLAGAGHPVLRFDMRGMGDSSGDLRSFEHITPDIGAAVDALLRHVPAVQRVVLWGLCDGASAALLYLHERADRRVAGLCLLNPWVRSETTLARTHVKHYYLQRLREKEFWVKLARGGVAGGALRGLVDNLRRARRTPAAAASPESLTYQERMAAGWAAFQGPVLLALSGNDYTAKEFLEFSAATADWQRLLGREAVTRCDLDEADHTLSTVADKDRINRTTIAWLGRLAAACRDKRPRRAAPGDSRHPRVVVSQQGPA